MISKLISRFFYKPSFGAIIPEFTDPRNIPVSSLSISNITSMAMQYAGYIGEYSTNIDNLKRYNQKQQPSCVGHARANIIRHFEAAEKGILIDPSPRFGYAIAKQIDGIPDIPGTFPSAMDWISGNIGFPTDDIVPNNVDLSLDEYINVDLTEEIRKSAYPYRTKNYGFVNFNDKDEIRRSLIQFQLIEITISVGWYNWFDGRFYPRPAGSTDMRYHRVIAFGFKDQNDDLRINILNSWGSSFGNNGCGYFMLSDYLNVPHSLSEWKIFTDIPNEILKDYKSKWTMKYFKPSEVVNLDMNFVEILDKARGLAGVPFKITSGFRTVQKNKQVGGSPNSSHLRGLAVDLACTNNTSRTRILKGLLNCGTPLFIEICRSHIHVDMDSAIHPLGDTMWADDE